MRSKKTTICAGLALIGAAILAPQCTWAGSPQGIPQASITLQNCDAQYCYTHNNTWTLTKVGTPPTIDANGYGTVSWLITATLDPSAAPTFTVHGGLTVYNSGTAPATIGNIVVNLQKPNNKKINGKNIPWVSAAADVADATYGDAVTSANIVAAGSAEDPAFNLAYGAGNYTVSGARGTFVTTAGSGIVDFKDASDNTVFSLVPEPTIPVGQSVTLLYDATFNISILASLPAGTLLRVETLVTFGNAGARGGSGATASNIDINGNGTIDLPDEANVRTVPCRITLAALPTAPSECNATATVTDTGATVKPDGTVTISSSNGFDQFPVTITGSAYWTVSVDVNSGADGGEVCNEADLAGAACTGTLNVVVGTDNGNPIYASFECAPAAYAPASNCQDVSSPSGGCTSCSQFNNCTYTQGGWGGTPNGSNPAQLLEDNFATQYPGGITVGGVYTMTFSSAAAVGAYLPAGHTAGVLSANLVNPTSTSSGVFGGQVLALQINVGFSNVGLIAPGLGGLYYCNGLSDSLSGSTIIQILAAANMALGGGSLPPGYTISTLNDLVSSLNESLDNCSVSEFATLHLSTTGCP